MRVRHLAKYVEKAFFFDILRESNRGFLFRYPNSTLADTDILEDSSCKYTQDCKYTYRYGYVNTQVQGRNYLQYLQDLEDTLGFLRPEIVINIICHYDQEPTNFTIQSWVSEISDTSDKSDKSVSLQDVHSFSVIEGLRDGLLQATDYYRRQIITGIRYSE